jgi:Emfourin
LPSIRSEEKATVQIRFQMSGGFGGLFATAPLSYETNTDDLPRQEADLLQQLVEEAGLLAARQRPPARSEGIARDVFQYQVQVITGSRTYRYDFDDTTVPDRARPLLDHLTAAAMHQRTGGSPEMT